MTNLEKIKIAIRKRVKKHSKKLIKLISFAI